MIRKILTEKKCVFVILSIGYREMFVQIGYWDCFCATLSIMESSKLFELLSVFSGPDLRQLDQVLHSPFFNQRDDLPRLFGYLRKCIETGATPRREEAFALAYPDERYDYARLRHLMSFLYKQAENVLVEQEMERDPGTRNTLLVRGLHRRNADKPLRSTLNARTRILQKAPIRNTDFHLHRIETLRIEMSMSEARTEKLQVQFQELAGEIDLFFILHKLQMACAALTHQRLFSVEYDLGMLEIVLRHIETHKLDQIPEVAVCYACYLMLAEPGDAAHYYRLKALMPETERLYHREESRTFYTHLINFCISRINRGEGDFLREVYEIYRLALRSDVLLDDGLLSPFTYKNIVSAAIKLREFAWAEDFIGSYQEKLPEENRVDFHAYNLARLHHANGNFQEVVRILNRLYIQDPFTHLDGRIILIKAYYELGEYKLIEYLLDNLKHHLRRKEFLTYHKKNYKAFTGFTRRLLNLPDFKKAQRQKLAEEIRAAELLTEREWLMEKLGVEPT